jgi:quercetin dioxygenase-like cupin family protein
MIRFKLDDLVRFDDQAPSLVTLLESGHTRVLLVAMRPGQKLKDHRAPSQVTVHVLKGTALLLEGGRPTPLQAGDLVFLPPGAVHRLEATEECAALVTLSPHPAGEAYPKDQRDRLVPQARHEAL